MSDPAAEAQHFAFLYLAQGPVAVRVRVVQVLALAGGLNSAYVELGTFRLGFQVGRHGDLAFFQCRQAYQDRINLRHGDDVIHRHVLDRAPRHGGEQGVFRVLPSSSVPVSTTPTTRGP